ncbi:MAG TPA: TraR/DksA C4-type zinc finger protein [Thermoleophilaceae bacterium]|nr:TraR/DksA C4-type zinc finger protein [Thermoleophilaceae bacterium]
MSPDRRRRIESLLDARVEELRRIRAAMHRSSDGMRDSELAHVDNHPADTGTDLHDEELDETTDIFMDEEERRIAEARRALADGSYGTCRECKRKIPANRLRAMPEVVRCVECQRRFEGLHRQQTRI